MSVILYPLSTEKSLGKMESNNTLVFVVDKKASKSEIMKEIAELLKAKVESVNTVITKGEKHAYVRFDKSISAVDIANNLGLM